MCGIAGQLRFDGKGPAPSALQAMTDALRHRGPDGEGSYLEGPVALGHRRLSIIDLEGGRQPLANEDETVWITFNGEIYNFQELTKELEARGHCFRTHSDTEVILHAYEQWGEACLGRLRGMFAFAIWDQPRRQLFLARDRIGIKPLYYARLPNMFAFASELQAFRALGDFRPNLDMQALDLYLHFQYIPAPYSIYREVRKLPPAHFVILRPDGEITGPTRYWELSFRPNPRLSEAQWLERLDATLQEAVKLHLVSDVPFGAFLSGGVDSSTVVAYMSKVLHHPVRTFSVKMDVPEYDESSYAQEVAKRFGTEHHEEVIRPDAIEVLGKLARHYGEPFADSSAIPTYYVSRVAAAHVKMVLSGDGGDENFAGYHSYASLAWEQRKPNTFLGHCRHVAGNLARTLGVRRPLPRASDQWYVAASYFDEPSRQQLWRPEYQSLLRDTKCWYEDQVRRAPQLDVCSRFQYLDIQTYLPFDILTKVDIASMCHGLEVRVPLLDHVVMELAAEMPVEYKLRNAGSRPGNSVNGKNPRGTTPVGKYIFKKNAERFFSPAFLHRPKMGFSIPIDAWFKGSLRSALESRLLDRSAHMYAFFRPDYVQDLLTRHLRGERHDNRLWALLFFTEWLDQHKV